MRITLDAGRVRFEVIPHSLVATIYADDYVKEQYRDDLDSFGVTNNDKASYVGVYVDGVLAGMFYCIEISSLETEVHLAFFKDYRYMVRDICYYFIDFMMNENNVFRLTTFVHDYRRTVVNMLLKLGFKYEGFMNKCVIRDGKFYGKHVMGITRG